MPTETKQQPNAYNDQQAMKLQGRMGTGSKMFSSRFGMAICLIGIGYSASASLLAQDENPLRWKFSEGDSYTIQLGQSSSLNSLVNKRKDFTEQNVQVWMEWTTDIVEDHQARMTWKFTRVHSKSSSIKTRTTGEEGESPVPKVIEFDTDAEKPSDQSAAKLWEGVKPLIDQPFKITMSDRGEITGVAIPPETMEILREFPGSMRIRQLMTEQGVKEIFGRTSITLPEDSIQEGHSWVTARSFEIPLGSIKQTTSYTYKGEQQIEDVSGHLIDAESKSEIDSFVEDGRPKLKIVSQESSGKLWFDASKGMMQSAEVKSTMKTATPYRDMEIEAEMTSELSLKIEKK